MLTYLVRALAALMIWVGSLGCSPAPPLPEERPAGPPSDPASPGLVWRVSGGKAPFFLAGSFHLLRASDYPLPTPYETAWQESTHLVFEIPPGDASRPETQAALAPLMKPASGFLQDQVGPETWQEFSAWARGADVALPSLQTQPPWLAALTVALTGSRQAGFGPEHGIETWFISRLAGSGKTTEGLETAVSQMSLLSQLPAQTQEAMLRQALADAATLPKKAAALTAAWRAGDTETLHASLSDSFKDFPELRKMLIGDRNAAWLPRLEAILQSDRPTMVLVGAGHLCGPGSLVDLLQAKGFRCVQIRPAKAESPLRKAG